MPSALINAFTAPLIASPPPTFVKPSEPLVESPSTAERKETLRALLVTLNASPSLSRLENCANTLVRLERDVQHNSPSDDREEEALKNAATYRLLVNLYADALDTYLSQAMQAEAEADWWGDIERSRFRVLMYLLQTLPLRIANLTRTVVHALRAQELPIQLSAFSPASLRRLFPSRTFQPGVLTVALFPHLKQESFSVTNSAFLYPYYVSKKPDVVASALTAMIYNFIQSVSTFISLPIELARQECKHKRRELEKLRDRHAENLGRLAFLRGALAENVNAEQYSFQLMAAFLEQTVSDDETRVIGFPDTESPGPLSIAIRLSSFIATSKTAYEDLLAKGHLRRPSRFVQLWPRLLLLPPLCLYGLRYVYASRASIVQVLEDARKTAVGFVRGWLIEPLRDVLRTVRTGGEDSIIIRREAVDADLQSLERMALSLAKDELGYSPDQLQGLSQKIKVGDLTPVLEIYEEDIKHPIKSAVLGSLLRSVLIQVQKAKVDIDQTLTGVDKLLKSQELTFAFVGVAPAFAIVYFLGGSLISLYYGGRGRGRYGGTAKRAAVFTVMRRIERLLVSQPSKKNSHNSGRAHDPEEVEPPTPISPLTSGLLLLAVARLRTFAETSLPVRSRIRDGFLEDVADLEDPDLGRREKLFVIERMWRCWSPVLGWNTATILE